MNISHDKVIIGELPVDEVLDQVSINGIPKFFVINGYVYKVKMNSSKYFLLKSCRFCVSCGLVGTKMLLERYDSETNFHFNLYGEENGDLICMTKDHIIPKSCGGKDCHSNYQTMCSLCNSLKGHFNLSLDNLRKIRLYYNQNKNKDKKVLFENLEKMRKELEDKINPEKNNKFIDCYCVPFDINVYEKEGQFYGFSMFNEASSSLNYIGCIKKGTNLEMSMTINKNILCKIDKENDVLICV